MTDLQEDVSTIIRYAQKRVTIENSYKDAKRAGFGEYRFRKSEAALIHAHLVFLAYILLQIREVIQSMPGGFGFHAHRGAVP